MSQYLIKYKIHYLAIFGALFFLIKLSFNNIPSIPGWKQTLTSLYYVVLIASAYFITIYRVVPLLLQRQTWKAAMLYSVIIVVAGTVLILFKYYTLRDGTPKFEKTYWSTFNLLAGSYLILFLTSSAGAAFRFLAEQNKTKFNLEIALKEKTDYELSLLKGQLNPHFLFNSINTVFVQIDSEPGKAKNTLHSFSELLRYQLYECNANNVPLAKEAHYLKNYIALQKARKDHRYRIEADIQTDFTGEAIAPLLFIPFVENAFKYVSNLKKEENLIEIILKTNQDNLCFSVVNTVVPPSEYFKKGSDNSGIGLANVKRRLELLYPHTHQLVIDTKNGLYSVNLKLKLR